MVARQARACALARRPRPGSCGRPPGPASASEARPSAAVPGPLTLRKGRGTERGPCRPNLAGGPSLLQENKRSGRKRDSARPGRRPASGSLHPETKAPGPEAPSQPGAPHAPTPPAAGLGEKASGPAGVEQWVERGLRTRASGLNSRSGVGARAWAVARPQCGEAPEAAGGWFSHSGWFLLPFLLLKPVKMYEKEERLREGSASAQRGGS